MYPGKNKLERDVGLQTYNVITLSPQESPVNLFEPNINAFPLFRFVGQTYSEHLEAGDCIYMPAYYFHQIAASAPQTPTLGKIPPSAILVSLKYSSNNDLLRAFYSLIEKGLIE